MNLSYILAYRLKRQLVNVTAEELEDLLREVREVVMRLLRHLALLEHLDLLQVGLRVETWSDAEEEQLEGSEELHELLMRYGGHRDLSHDVLAILIILDGTV